MAGNSHGHTPAAWTGVVIVIIGFTIGGVFMVLAQPLGVVAGLLVAVLGGVVTLVMNAMGLGAEKSTPPLPTTSTGSSAASATADDQDGEQEKVSVA